MHIVHNKTAEITISNFISMQVSTFISIYKEPGIPSPTPMTAKKRAFSVFHLQCNRIFSVAFKCCKICRNTAINQAVRSLARFLFKNFHITAVGFHCRSSQFRDCFSFCKCIPFLHSISPYNKISFGLV